MKFALLVSAVLVLGGCVAEQPATGQNLANLQAVCTAYGFKPGSADFSNCVMQMDAQRINENRQRRLAVAAALQNAGANMQMQAAMNRPRTCTTTGSSTFVGGTPTQFRTVCN